MRRTRCCINKLFPCLFLFNRQFIMNTLFTENGLHNAQRLQFVSPLDSTCFWDSTKTRVPPSTCEVRSRAWLSPDACSLSGRVHIVGAALIFFCNLRSRLMLQVRWSRVPSHRLIHWESAHIIMILCLASVFAVLGTFEMALLACGIDRGRLRPVLAYGVDEVCFVCHLHASSTSALEDERLRMCQFIKDDDNSQYWYSFVCV